MLLPKVFFAASTLSTVLAGGESSLTSGNICPYGVVKGFYSVEIDLQSVPEACGDDDYELMGSLLGDIVREVDEIVPQYSDEFLRLRTEICDVPSDIVEEMPVVRSRLLGADLHRRLGRYAAKYLGGGECRRCSADNIDRRRRNLGGLEASAELVCQAAEETVLAAEIAEMASELVSTMVLEVITIAKDLKNEEERSEIIKKAKEGQERCALAAKVAMDAAETATKQCQSSTNDMKVDLSKLMKMAQEASKQAMDAAKSAEERTVEVKKVLLEMKTKIHTENLALRSIEIENTIEDMEADMQNQLDNISDPYEREQKKQELEEEIKRQEEELKDQREWDAEMGFAMLEVEGAKSQEDWFGQYKDLLKVAIPKRLYDEYVLETGGPGCLDEKIHAEVSVEAVNSLDDIDSGVCDIF